MSDFIESISVLHVDDESAFAEMAAEFIEREDERITVEIAENANEGLDQLTETDFDCIISDFNLPGKNGIEYLKAVREDYPDLPFILYTGEGSEEVASEAISAGVTDYLQKGHGTDQYPILVNRITNAVARSRSRQEEQRTRESFEAIFEYSSDYVLVIDESGEVRYATPAVERILGYTPDELQGDNPFEYVHPEDESHAIEAFSDALDHPGDEQSVEFRARRDDGSWRWLEARARNLLDAPVIDGVLVSIRDVTEDHRRRERRDSQQQTLIKLATDAAVATGDFESALHRITETAAAVLDVPRVNIWIFDDEDGESVLTCVDHFDRSTGEHERGRELTTQEYPAYLEALKTHRSIDATDARDDPRTTELADYLDGNDIGALLDATIRSEGDTIGVVCNEHVGGTREWTDDEIDFASGIADIVHRALRNQERKKREQELKKYKKAVKQAPHAVFITDADGTIEYVNPAFESITGYSVKEAVGKKPRILKSGEMSTDYYEDLWDTISSGDVWEETVINRQKAGELYHAHQTIAPITDANERVQKYVAIQTDISDRVHQKRALQEQKQRYESLFTSIRDAILVADTDRRIVNCNPAFTEMFGYELEEIEGRQTKYVYESEEEYEAMEAAIEDRFDDPLFATIVNYVKKSGQVFPGETNVYSLRNSESEITGFIKLIRDVSGRRDRVTQLQVIDRVLRHNLHNEMNVIIGNAELITEMTTGDVASSAKKIIDTGNRLLKTTDKGRLITNLLTDPPAHEPINLVEIIDATVSKIAERHPTSTLTVNAPETCLVIAAPEITRAIEEIIENAIEHSDREQPRVEVSIEQRDSVVSVVVADDGPGIPEMEQKVLTGEEAIEPLYHGSGMGLWFVNLVVRRSDGVLEFGENEPRGSVVTIDLPTD